MNTLGCKDTNLSNPAFVQDIYTLSVTTVNLSTLDNVQVLQQLFMKAKDIREVTKAKSSQIKRQLACAPFSLHDCL